MVSPYSACTHSITGHAIRHADEAFANHKSLAFIRKQFIAEMKLHSNKVLCAKIQDLPDSAAFFLFIHKFNFDSAENQFTQIPA
jgi:hypothetical protein